MIEAETMELFMLSTRKDKTQVMAILYFEKQ
jgi:hypothetical protein